MKSFLSILTVFIVSMRASAKEDWICVEASSQRVGNTIQSCGIGVAGDEASARLKAFDSAKAEFDRLCAASDDCKGRKVTVDPRRTTCEPAGGGFKCYRMLSFIIADSLQQVQTQPSAEDPILGPTQRKTLRPLTWLVPGMPQPRVAPAKPLDRVCSDARIPANPATCFGLIPAT